MSALLVILKYQKLGIKTNAPSLKLTGWRKVFYKCYVVFIILFTYSILFTCLYYLFK